MKVDLFDFDLPEKFIAKYPLKNRSDAKLLLVPELENKHVYDLPDILEKDSLIVFNNTKVIPARLYGKLLDKVFEVTLHKNLSLNTWLGFIKNSKKLKIGDSLYFGDELFGIIKSKKGESGCEIEFNVEGHKFFDILSKIGTLPLPPYLKREVTNEDKVRYQTVYAKEEGAVASPTAGLHFTEELLNKLKNKGIETAEITLHVGAGTFQPVKVDDTKDHKMHSEYIIISKEVADKINKAKKNNNKIIAVGTTVLRSLESSIDKVGNILPCSKETDIFITPPYKFKSVDYLMTNFHLPKSTLFMLVSAFAGLDNMKKVYEFAKQNNYRFYSYGDSSLLKRKDC